jgi:hypothetical protein
VFFHAEKFNRDDMNEEYLKSVRQQFEYYQSIGEKAMAQLQPEQLFVASNDASNSIATIVKHLWGNMLSRWTNFLTEDGEKDWRKRDEEFEVNNLTADEVLNLWKDGWQCLYNALHEIQPHQLLNMITIRNESHTVVAAINRQLAHYAYHVGQIVFVAKQIKHGDWDSLSIPKNKSAEFNAMKFGKKAT